MTGFLVGLKRRVLLLDGAFLANDRPTSGTRVAIRQTYMKKIIFPIIKLLTVMVEITFFVGMLARGEEGEILCLRASTEPDYCIAPSLFSHLLKVLHKSQAGLLSNPAFLTRRFSVNVLVKESIVVFVVSKCRSLQLCEKCVEVGRDGPFKCRSLAYIYNNGM